MPITVDKVRVALAARYAIEDEIGRGGMAVVFRATRLADGLSVAVKVLRPEVAATLGPDRFQREIAFLQQLVHPNILPLLESDDAGPFIYFVMPFASGESLKTRIRCAGHLAVDVVVDVACQMAAALDHAHQHNVLHRDIKPENILEHDGRWTLCDFGVARALALAGPDSLSPSGIVIGTPAYMSPEQGAPGTVLDGRSDLYALGCVLYEALAGVPPFTGPTPQAVIARHARERPPSLRVVRPDVPPPVAAALERALAKRPTDRPRSVGELAGLLSPAS